MRFSPFILASMILSACCSADTLVTRDGKTHIGKARLEKDALTLTPSSAKPLIIPFDQLASLTFDAPVAQTPPPATQPAHWRSADVGPFRRDKGNASVESDRIVLFDSTTGLRGGKEDSLFFFHQKIRNSATLVARVRAFAEDKYSRAGIAMRSSLDPDAPMVALVRSRSGQSGIVRRSSEGSTLEEGAISTQRVLGATWLKLERRGYTFTASESTDGKNWAVLGSVEVPMPEEILVGLASASASGAGGRSIYDCVALTADPADPASSVRSPRGLMTVDGSILGCDIAALDQEKVQFLLDGKMLALPLQKVARLAFTPLLPAHEEKLAAATGAGVLLINGDFLQGDIKSIADGQLKITSVLFGAKSIDIRREATAMSLRAPAPAKCEWEIRLTDRSLLRATALKWSKDAVTVIGPALGELTLPASRLLQITRP